MRRIPAFLCKIACAIAISGAGLSMASGHGVEVRKSPDPQPDRPEVLASETQTQHAKTAEPSVTPALVDPRKSILITDVAIMNRITFGEVMQQLARQSGDPDLDRLALFRQWWSSAGEAPGQFGGPHCEGAMNGFSYICPREEAAEAKSDPFADPSGEQGYSAIAYSNRPDLAEEDAGDCGEYRLVFARNSGKTDEFNRNFIAFEARIKNPRPSEGLGGCRDIQKFWADLSTIGQEERGDRLRDFYLNGLPSQGVRKPVIHIENFSSGAGQIRTNQFMNQDLPTVWTLREFNIRRMRPGILIAPTTAKTNPDISLFSGAAPAGLQREFLARLSDEFDSIRGGGDESSQAAIALRLKRPSDDRFNSFESNAGNAGGARKGGLSAAFAASQNLLMRYSLSAQIARLNGPDGAGSALTPEHIVERIQTQTCAGCHRWSNNRELGGGAGRWPASLGFTHLSERKEDLERAPEGGDRYRISRALRKFIPQRCAAMARILKAGGTLCEP